MPVESREPDSGNARVGERIGGYEYELRFCSTGVWRKVAVALWQEGGRRHAETAGMDEAGAARHCTPPA
jgi:hypothetical protein